MLKVRWGGDVRPSFPTYLRDYGFLLLLLPSVWMIWASWFANRPRVGTGPPPPILVSGLGLLGFLLVLAFAGTALSSGSIIQVSPQEESTSTLAIMWAVHPTLRCRWSESQAVLLTELKRSIVPP